MTTIAVPHGTADALARIHHFRGLDLPEAYELDDVTRFLLGRVPDADELIEQLGDDLDQLWSLLTDDYDDDQLDELSDRDFRRFDFATYGQEVSHRHSCTVARLVHDVEQRIHVARVVRAEQDRPTRTAVAS
jgi:hypothetical protein